MEGFLHWVTDELGRFSSIQRATKGGHTTIWALLSLVLVARLVRSLLCIQVPLYFITCCISCFNHHYIDRYPKLVSPRGGLGGGLIQGHVDQKYLYTKMHVLVF